MSARLGSLVVVASLAVVACVTVGGAQGATAPKSQSPTRLVHGPAIFRLTGYQDVDPGGGRDEWRYLVVYKLNQDVVARPEKVSELWRTVRGDYAILDLGFEIENSPQKFGRPGCFALIVFGPGDVTPDGDPTVQRLKRIPLGGRVKVKLRPLTPAPTGGAKLGKSYVSYPHLRRADVSLNSGTARRELRRIGCKNRPLP